MLQSSRRIKAWSDVFGHGRTCAPERVVLGEPPKQDLEEARHCSSRRSDASEAGVSGTPVALGDASRACSGKRHRADADQSCLQL